MTETNRLDFEYSEDAIICMVKLTIRCIVSSGVIIGEFDQVAVPIGHADQLPLRVIFICDL